jgi:hypothetical protein
LVLGLATGGLIGCGAKADGERLLDSGLDTADETETETEFEYTCFVAGTRVWTEEGPKPIESIEAGCRVWSWDTVANAPVLRTVTKRITGRANKTTRVQAGELVIEGVTDEHPFWIPADQVWRDAADLRAGMGVLAWLGQHDAKVLAIAAPTPTRHAESVAVYTLSVEGPEHNFFAEGILVHNKGFSGTLIDTVDFACVDGAFVLSIQTVGWTGSGRFNLWETGNASGWDEEHPISSVDYDPNMWWDFLQVTLPSNIAPTDFVPGENTVFDCGVHDIDPVMTWMARVTDTTGVDADCWLQATDPNGIAALQSGDGPTNNPMSNPEDIASCNVYTQ